jgi:predicted nucleic acid-binding protein
VIDRLSTHDLVGLDTPIFIYHLEGVQRYAEFAALVFDAIELGTFNGVTSPITFLELAVRPFQLGRPDVADEYEARLELFPNLTVSELSRATVRMASMLMARHQLHGPDAMQIAACLQHGATAFLTNDIRLRKVTELDVIVLYDFLDPA